MSELTHREEVAKVAGRLPRPGTLVRDRETGQTGVLMDVARERQLGRVRTPRDPRGPIKVFIRPAGGGLEWSAWPWDVERVEGGTAR